MDFQTSLVTYLVYVSLLLVIQGEGEVVLLPIVLGTDLHTGGVLGLLQEEQHLPALLKRFAKWPKFQAICLSEIQLVLDS